jgi:hypothetical protein
MSFLKNNPSVTTDHLAGFLVVLGTLIGLMMRLSMPLISLFPLNDGGLFYTMIRDLQYNRYALPLSTSYNSLDLPFAYPPFGLYVSAFIVEIFRVPLLDFLRLAPGVLSACCIPIFFLLATEFLGSRIISAVAAVLFALTPRIFEWQIMGGGITRSFGMVFSLLTMLSVIRLYKSNNFKHVIGAAIFGALTVLSHPEAVPHTLIAVGVFYLFLSRSRRVLLESLLVSAFVILLTSPWWLTIVNRSGPGPFLAAISTAGVNNLGWFQRLFMFLRFEFTSEPYLPFIAVLSVVGFIRSFLNRNFFLPAWMSLDYLLEPRSGSLFMLIPLVMLSAIGIETVVSIVITRSKSLAEYDNPAKLSIDDGYANSRFIKSIFPVFIVFLTYLMLSAYVSAFFIFERVSLKQADIQGFGWINANVDEDAEFLLITNAEPLLDPLSEWFPALTERKSLATVFGNEWVPGANFQTKVSRYEELQRCSGRSVTCIEDWADQKYLEFDYVLIKKQPVLSILEYDLRTNPGYSRSFENSSLIIYRRAIK